MRATLPAVAALLAASLSLGGCDRGARRAAFVERDSAGITIAESRQPEWEAGAGWHIIDSPSLRIGAAEDVPGHDLYEVGGAVILSDGTIAIANRGSSEIRMFDAEGNLVRAFGRPGDGPGEFRSLSRIFLLPGDSILVTDPGLDRITVISPTGALVRTAPMERTPDGGIPGAVLRLRDGALIARSGFSFGAGTAAGVHRDTIPLYRYGTDGRFESALGRFPMSERFVYHEGGNSLAGERIWGRATWLAAAADGFVVAYSDDWSFELRAPDGTLRRVVRARRPLRRVTDADIERLATSAAESDPSGDAFWRRLLAATEFPSHFPAYAQLVTDSEGHVWLQDYVWPQEHTSRSWQVFDPAGRWLGAVTLPAGFEPLHIGRNTALGVVTDELGVEQVHAYPLSRAPSPRRAGTS